ncbi:MAG: hypothetical protein KGP14_16835, partial [Betaproteobacteria bacterium]|nr:hypothetical protein [Betaproteobacteria bacterium]
MPSVIDQQPFNEYAGNGVTTLFAYEFQILAAEDMVVRVDGVTIPSSSYTLTGVGVQAGGTVEFGAAPANGTTVLLSREMTLERSTDYQEQGDLLADTVNNDFNRLWLAFQEFYSGGRGVPTALRVPLGESIDPLPVAADRDGYLLGFAGGSWVLVPGQSGTATSLALDLANTAFGKGASLIGLQDAADYFASATVEGAIAELGLAKKKLVDVSAYPWLADMTGATDSSAKVFAAQTYAQSIGAGIYIPPGTLLAGIDIHYNNAVIIGAGSYLTRIKLPTSTVAITSIATASNVLTVQCASTSTLWVGRSIRITGTTASAHNSGFIVTSVDSATQFKCQQLNTTVTGSSTGGNFSAANVIDCGRLCDGNLATAYSGLVLRGFTVDGMRGTRPTPTSDLTDWGIALTNFTKFNITDVRGVDCWNAGIAAFINSNYGHAQGQVENCGFSSTNPAGF